MLQPAIILVRPQLGMNIGMVARAMANFALSDLRLVAPRDGWPNPDAGPPAAGADDVLATARLFDNVAEAMADCHLGFATTVRPRDMPKPVITPHQAAGTIRTASAEGQKSAFLFGPERSGLTADDLAAVQTIVTCPVNPDFRSLNLAQAVLLIAYEWFQADTAAIVHQPALPPAQHGEVAGLIGHLEQALDAAGYFHVAERTPSTKRTLADLLTRARFTSDEVRNLRGVIRALSEGRKKRPGAIRTPDQAQRLED